MVNISGKEKTKRGSRSTKVKEKECTNSVPFYKLFAYADSKDHLLMIVGTIGAISNGVCTPIMTILLGDLVNAFGENQNNNNVVHVVSKVHNNLLTPPYISYS
ncbi:putative ABC transporter type 1, transmembrane domain superfamily [Helianthus annuus]|nr:putative ABC transporter type 1, transmembrane domain superfamily [Helianthus annuus]